jgi:hypothetical protein
VLQQKAHDSVTRQGNKNVQVKVGLPSIFTLYANVIYVYRMEGRHIPNDLCYGKLAPGERKRGCPYKTASSRTLKYKIKCTATRTPTNAKVELGAAEE